MCWYFCFFLSLFQEFEIDSHHFVPILPPSKFQRYLMENKLTDGDLAGILLLDPKGHLTGCLVALLIIFVTSLPLKYLFYDQKTRWFALHALANFAISTYAVPDILSTINAPEQSMTDAMFSWYPSYISFSIHLYW